VVSPNVEAGGDILGTEDLVEVLVVGPADIFVSGDEDVSVMAVLIEVPKIGEIGEVVGRKVEVAVVVEVAVEEAGWIAGSAERKDGVEDIWVTEADVDCVIAAEAAPYGSEVGYLGVFANEGEDLLQDVLLVLEVASDARTRTDVAVVPALAVDGVDAEDLEISMSELVMNGVDHTAVLELEEAAAGGGKDECWEAGVTEDEQFHLPTEQWGKPSLIFALHAWALC
jgi:hypothetical protein